MKITIVNSLKRIESEHKVKILYSCDSGSRAWGYNNIDSDYDVRFIYIHPPSWYLSIERQEDFIDLPKSDLLDITGWDLQKCLKLYQKSNPSILECIHSSVIYIEPFSTIVKLRNHTKDIFSPVACMYHYLHMAQKNYKKQGARNEVKKYLNTLRLLLAAKWIEKKMEFPPVNFSTLVKKIVTANSLQKEIESLTIKKEQRETSVFKVNLINDYVENELNHLFEYVKKMEKKEGNPVSLLNEIFFNSINEAWGIKIF